ncbi:uncharacterized protein LOC126844752 [Adelges cooleyi]|uniref:uncharacterized protein LOC126844752 n=1 Tax=Adelges cooleyi TaxID=133065 RepID=UPI0021805309|nr:uncharacterized protein LOC126844752 [Adelges cooleyi]
MIDVEAGELLLHETPALPRLQRAATEDQVLLKTVTPAANNGWYAEYVGVPLTYLIGVPAGWLLLGAFQYFVCVITLGDTLLDPWYFTCAWLVEIVCTLHAVIIFMIIKCMYVRVGILDYCEKITWIGFTYLLAQGLAIILLLLPASHIFKKTFGDFSEPSNFFIYWTMVAFPHIMSLCFASFGCCSKMFGSISRCLRYVSHKNKHQRAMIPVHFDVTKQQVSSSTDRDGNNIELQELNFHPSFNLSEKNLRFTF